jgi:cell division septum initiation protein DivIVA
LARLLDVSESAVHKRVQRGTLPHDKAPDGRVFVYLDDVVDTVADTVQHPSTDALISEMRSRIDDLREQLEAERHANEENRRIIAALTSRIPPAIEAPREAAETAATEAEGQEGPFVEESRPERSWWRRWFGFE